MENRIAGHLMAQPTENKNRISGYIMGQAGLREVVDSYEKIGGEIPFTRTINGLQKFVDKANDIKENSFDITIHGKDIRPIVDDEGIRLQVGDQPFYLSRWALGQFSQEVGIPSQYALNMAKAGKFDLFLNNFNSWIDSDIAGKKFLVRVHKDHIRGILTDRYQPVDSDFLLPSVANGLIKSNMDFKIDRGLVNPEFANVRMLSDRQIDVGGDPHYIGFRAATSDVGRASLTVEFFIFRSRCTNGMLFGKHGGTLVRKTHTSKDMLKEGYIADLIEKQFSHVDELVAMTTEALKDARSKTLKNEDIERVIERFHARTKFGKKDAEFLFANARTTLQEYDDKPSVWAISNALTQLAQSYSVDRAEEIEDFAGDFLFTSLGYADEVTV